MDIKSELSSNQIVLLVMSGAEYNNVIVDVIKQLSGNICYVTANKTFDALKEIFEKKKINTEKIVFIDSISKTIKKVPNQSDGVYYVASPGALTELSLVIEKFLKHEFDYIIFDSITNLGIYQKPKMCSKFITDLVNKIKKSKIKSIFYALDIRESAEIINHTGAMVDKVVKITDVKKSITPVDIKK